MHRPHSMAERRNQQIKRSRTLRFPRTLRFFVCLLAVLLPAHAFAQPASHFSHQAWTTEDGLPQNSVHQTLQTRDGYLWIATEGGLARFDGLNFTIFRHEDQPEFPSDDIACLAEDLAGALWIGTTDGLLRYRDGHFSQVSLGISVGPASVTGLAAAQDGSMLALTGSGVTHIVDGHATPLQEAPSSVGTLSAAPDHTVWVTTGNTLLQYSSGHLVRRGQLLSAAAPPLEVQVGSHGDAWLRSSAGLFNQILAPQPATVRDRGSHPLPGLTNLTSLITTFLQDDSGDLWIGTKRGLFVATLPGGAPVQVAAIGDRSVLSLSRDREGDLWIGTEADGLHILRTQKVEQIPGLGDHLLTALAQTGNGTVWIGTRDDGLRVYSAAATSAASAAATRRSHDMAWKT